MLGGCLGFLSTINSRTKQQPVGGRRSIRSIQIGNLALRTHATRRHGVFWLVGKSLTLIIRPVRFGNDDDTPPKTDMETENFHAWKRRIPIRNHHFQVPC